MQRFPPFTGFDRNDVPVTRFTFNPLPPRVCIEAYRLEIRSGSARPRQRCESPGKSHERYGAVRRQPDNVARLAPTYLRCFDLYQPKDASRTASAFFNLDRRNNQERSGRRQAAKICQVFQMIFAPCMADVMNGKIR